MDNDAHSKIDIKVTAYWVYAVVAFVFFVLLGIYGFIISGHVSVTWSSDHSLVTNCLKLLTAIYLTFQMVLLNAPELLHDYRNLPLTVAGFVLPLFPILALFKILKRVFGVQWSLTTLKIKPRKHVFLGAGRITASIAEVLKNTEKSILAIDVDAEQINPRRINLNPHVMLLEHDVNDRRFLKTLRLNKADCIYIFTGDDERNLDVAHKVVEWLLSKPRRTNPPRLIINIESQQLLAFASQNEYFTRYQKSGSDSKRGEIVWFSAAEQTARELLKQYPPVLKPQAHLHVGIVGQSHIVDEIAVQVIQQSFAKRSSKALNTHLHITVFSASSTCYDNLLKAHPVLKGSPDDAHYGYYAPLATTQFVEIGDNSITPEALVQAMSLHQDKPLDALYIAEPTDHSCITRTFSAVQAASVLPKLSELSVTMCLAGDTFGECYAARQAISTNMHNALLGVHWFHGIYDIFNENESYPGETSDLLGIFVDAAYRLDKGLPDHAISDAVTKKFEENRKKDWLSMPEAFRASSRFAGDHFAVKLRHLGFVFERRDIRESVIDAAQLQAKTLKAEDIADWDRLTRGLNNANDKSTIQGTLQHYFNGASYADITALTSIIENSSNRASNQQDSKPESKVNDALRSELGLTLQQTRWAARREQWYRQIVKRMRAVQIVPFPAYKNAIKEVLLTTPREFKHNTDELTEVVKAITEAATAFPDEPTIDDTVIQDVENAICSDLEELSRMEHDRYVTERLMAGWLYHPENKKFLHLNKTLIPFEQLPEGPKDEKKKDEFIVRAMPGILHSEYVKRHFRAYRR